MTAAPGAALLVVRCAEIERGITRLVHDAPALDPAVIAELVGNLRDVGSPLARSIARVVELVALGRIAQGLALPHLAMSCATLAAGAAGRLTERELEAARYEVDTLLPLPEASPAPPPPIQLPDVPLVSLTRGSRRQT